MRRSLITVLITTLWLSAGAAVTYAAKPKSFKYCTAMNKVYRHGVGRKHADDKTSAQKTKAPH